MNELNMSDQNLTTPATGASQQDAFIEIAQEVKIPINECFISLSVPAGFFKFKEDTARRQTLVELQTALPVKEQLLLQQEQIPINYLFAGQQEAVRAQMRSEIAAMQAAVAALETPLH